MRSLSGARWVVSRCWPCGSVVGWRAAQGRRDSRRRRPSRPPTQAYQQQDYKKAAELYEQTIAAAPETQRLTRPTSSSATATTTSTSRARRATPANDALLTKAVENYQKAAEKLAASPDPADKKLGKLSLEYLVAAYGPTS